MSPTYTFSDRTGFVPIKITKTVLDDSKLTILDKNLSLYVSPGNVKAPESLLFKLTETEKTIVLRNEGKGPVAINRIVGTEPEINIEYPKNVLQPNENMNVVVTLDNNEFLDNAIEVLLQYGFSGNIISSGNAQITKLNKEPYAVVGITGYIKSDEGTVSIGKFVDEMTIPLTIRSIPFDYVIPQTSPVSDIYLNIEKTNLITNGPDVRLRVTLETATGMPLRFYEIPRKQGSPPSPPLTKIYVDLFEGGTNNPVLRYMRFDRGNRKGIINASFTMTVEGVSKQSGKVEIYRFIFIPTPEEG